MTSYTLYLSSNPSLTNVYLANINFSDITSVTVSLSGIDKSRIPTDVRFRWGDDTADEFHSNNFFLNYKELSILDQIQNNVNYTVLKDYSHIYYPSANSLAVKLSCQTLITYQDSTSCRFIQPITVYSPSYYAKIGDLKILNTNYIDTSRDLLYTFSTNDGSVIEFVFNSETL
jgi:hypothetical protein